MEGKKERGIEGKKNEEERNLTPCGSVVQYCKVISLQLIKINEK